MGIVRKFFPNVKAIVDAKTNAEVEVTEKDAASKAVKSHRECAMAVACKRKFHLDGVIISRSIAYLIKGNKARRFKVPESVSREVVSFDRGAGFSVGTYQLTKISNAAKLGPRGKPQKTKNREVKEPRKIHVTINVRKSLGGPK